MSEFLVFSIVFLIGISMAEFSYIDINKELTRQDKLIEQCEQNLPRDKHCILTAKVEDKE